MKNNSFSISYHEAAHAVVSALLNHRFNKVSFGLFDTLDLAGGMVDVYDNQIMNSPQAMSKNAKDLIQIFAAGQVGEQILHEQNLPMRSPHDYEVINTTVKSSGMSIDEVSGIVKETEALLRKNWGAVCLVAEGLRNNGSLSYEQVNRIVNN